MEMDPTQCLFFTFSETYNFFGPETFSRPSSTILAKFIFSSQKMILARRRWKFWVFFASKKKFALDFEGFFWEMLKIFLKFLGRT